MSGFETTPNVLYITIDSIRADRVGFSSGDGETTPILDELARTGTTFERAVANGIPTYYSFKSLLGGINSLSHARGIGLPPTATSIAEAFERAGYVTAGFNAKNPWLTPSYGYDRGFQTFEDFMGGADSGVAIGGILRKGKRLAKRSVSFSGTLTNTLGRYGRMANAVVGSQPLMPAEPVTEAAIDWLESADEPYFLWIHYMDPHYPWVPPKEYLSDVGGDLSRFEIGSVWHTVAHEYRLNRSSVDDRTQTKIEHLYDAEVKRTDASIGRLLQAVEAKGELDETVIAVAGDHGTELNDHGGFSHGPQTLYDEILRVPLLFNGPGIPSERRELAALVDVPRTITGLVKGVDTPDTFEGIDLFDDRRASVISEVVYDFDPARGQNADNGLLQAATAPPWKLIRNQHTDTVELYNVETDPAERDPVRDNGQVSGTLDPVLDDHRNKLEVRNRTIEEKARIRERVAKLKEAGEI